MRRVNASVRQVLAEAMLELNDPRIGLVTVTFIVDQGGLGRFIQDGYLRDFHTPLIVGIVLSVALAVVADLLLLRVERAVTPWRRHERAAA